MSTLDKVIASRLLTCTIDGHPQEVRINLGEPFEDNGAFTCPYEIVIGGQSTVLEITGIDGIQALQLALVMVGSSLGSMSRASDWCGANKVGSDFLPLSKSLFLVRLASNRQTISNVIQQTGLPEMQASLPNAFGRFAPSTLNQFFFP